MALSSDTIQRTSGREKDAIPRRKSTCYDYRIDDRWQDLGELG